MTNEPQYQQGATAAMPGPAAPYRPTNVLAIISMIASILGVVAIPILASIAGIIMGHIAKKQIAQTGEQGEGMAKAGLIVGYVGLGLWVLVALAWVLFVAIIFASASTSSY